MNDIANRPSNGSKWISRLVFIAFLGIGGFYLVTEHRAHLYGILPWLLLAAVPFLCIFMHLGHGHGGHDDAGQGEPSPRQTRPDEQDIGAGAHPH